MLAREPGELSGGAIVGLRGPRGIDEAVALFGVQQALRKAAPEGKRRIRGPLAGDREPGEPGVRESGTFLGVRLI